MKISRNWLQEYVDIRDLGVDELAERLTLLGLEIEAIERPGAEIQHVVVGQILTMDPHPDADKLTVCTTDVGAEAPLQIVCGAKNMKPGDRVPTAVVGATLPGGFAIGARKMRGVASQGMMCSGKELGLGEDHSGLMILPEDFPIGADVKPLLGLDDVVYEIEVTPNRNDWASMIGVARELAAYYRRPLRLPSVNVAEGETPVEQLSSVTIEAPDKCPRYLARVISGLQVGPSPQWMQQRLQAAGQRPINNLVDITNYVLLETGHPLHAFDYDRLAEHRIVVRHAQAGERMHTLDGQARTLEDWMLVIADAAKPQALAGIMGGGESEVGESTTRVLLESAYFEPTGIRKTSRKVGLVSESSQRFQRGADPEMAVFALDRAAMLFAELAQGTVARGRIDQHPKPQTQIRVTLRFARNNALLGATVPAEDQCAYLEGLGFELGTPGAESVEVGVPTWRPDVTREADLIEEIGRLHGFDKIAATLPRVRPVDQRFAPEDAPVRRLRHFLVGIGLTEFYSWTFTNVDEIMRAQLPSSVQAVSLMNPLSEKQALMRPSLIPGMLRSTAHNLNHGQDNVAAFEIGPIYHPASGDELPGQSTVLAIAWCGQAELHHWSHAGRPVDFYDLRGLLDAVGEFLGLSLTLQPSDQETYQPGQRAEILFEKKVVGTLGKVAPAAAKAYDIDVPLYILELNLAPLLAQQRPVAAFAEIPAFPPSLRDLAVIVEESVPAGELRAAAERAGGNLLRAVEVFDIYRGEPVPAGRKSVALSLRFQSPEKTLTDNDTQKAIDKILKSLEKDYQATLR